MTKYPIYQVTQQAADSSNSSNESEGRFYKYWCQHPQLGHCLFKAAVPDGFTATERSLDWSEKVASELGKLLGLPVADTEFAIGYAIERSEYINGTLSVDHSPGTQVISGRQFLSLVRIPEGRITSVSATFAKELLKYNSQQILGIELELVSSKSETDLAQATAVSIEKNDVSIVIVPAKTSNEPPVVEQERDDDLDLSR